MKSFLSLITSKHYWRNQFSLVALGKTVLGVVGGFVAVVEAAKKIWAFHDPNEKLIESFVAENYWTIVLSVVAVGVAIGFAKLLPDRKVVVTVKKRDMKVAIEVGDVFDIEDETLVIGTNRTFDTDPTGNLIDPRSLQAKFAEKYYGGHANLDIALDAALAGDSFDQLTPQEKRCGKLRQYPMGATVKLRAMNRDVYMVAIATMNGHGVASSSVDDFRVALGSFWQYVIEKGGGAPKLRMPVMGTGLAKLAANREVVIREIFRSFFAACSGEHFCTQLTIVVSVKDFIEHEINLKELGQYIGYLATYTEYKGPTDTGAGVGFIP